MIKKILVIKGSCRKGSYTNQLLEEALQDFQNAEISVFDTYSQKIAFCNGCNYCESNGKCVHGDLDEFFKEFEKADVVLFSSPVYNGSFSAPLKALVDRFQVYYTSFYKNGKVQPITKKRNGILLVSAGRSGTAALQTMEKDLSCAFTILNMELTGSALCAFTDTEPTYGEALKQLKMILKRSLSDE